MACSSNHEVCAAAHHSSRRGGGLCGGEKQLRALPQSQQSLVLVASQVPDDAVLVVWSELMVLCLEQTCERTCDFGRSWQLSALIVSRRFNHAVTAPDQRQPAGRGSA